MRWVPRQWWAGQDVFVIGGGPSLRDFDWDRLRGSLTIGCNDAFALGPSVCSVCTFGDLKWFNCHRRELEMFPNPVITVQPTLYENSPDWLLVAKRQRQGLHRDGSLGWGGNTGCIALNLALALGALRVFLLGFDMSMVDGQTNWHDHNLGTPNDGSYVRFAIGFERMAQDLPAVFPGREVINLTPGSKLNHFPKGQIDSYL